MTDADWITEVLCVLLIAAAALVRMHVQWSIKCQRLNGARELREPSFSPWIDSQTNGG